MHACPLASSGSAAERLMLDDLEGAIESAVVDAHTQTNPMPLLCLSYKDKNTRRKTSCPSLIHEYPQPHQVSLLSLHDELARGTP